MVTRNDPPCTLIGFGDNSRVAARQSHRGVAVYKIRGQQSLLGDLLLGSDGDEAADGAACSPTVDRKPDHGNHQHNRDAKKTNHEPGQLRHANTPHFRNRCMKPAMFCDARRNLCLECSRHRQNTQAGCTRQRARRGFVTRRSM